MAAFKVSKPVSKTFTTITHKQWSLWVEILQRMLPGDQGLEIWLESSMREKLHLTSSRQITIQSHHAKRYSNSIWARNITRGTSKDSNLYKPSRVSKKRKLQILQTRFRGGLSQSSWNVQMIFIEWTKTIAIIVHQFEAPQDYLCNYLPTALCTQNLNTMRLVLCRSRPLDQLLVSQGCGYIVQFD